MSALVTMKGPNTGQRFPLDGSSMLIGRQPDAAIYLESLAVSRQHARLVCDQGAYAVEDVGSSNGTFVNGIRISGKQPLRPGDSLQVGPYVLVLQPDLPATLSSSDTIVRAQVNAALTNQNLFAQNPAYKLKVVLEIAQNLGQTLEMDPLLSKLLDQLLGLFPQADRGMVLLGTREQLTVRAQRSRHKESVNDFPYSKTIVRRALDEGIGLLSEDVAGDPNLVQSATLVSLNLRSFLCVPLIGRDGARLGVLQLDNLRASQPFQREDLELLTAIGLQVATVLENAALHAERLREARLRQELVLAREIQLSFLPTTFDLPGAAHAELFARVHPAREVSGDLYDFFPLPDGRLVFFLGDVSGKGVPAALFMIAVHTLARHLAPSAGGPAELLHRLNQALAADNPTALFVTVALGVYDDRDGSVLLASGGHPPPLLRHPDGKVETVEIRPGFMLGYSEASPAPVERRLSLNAGDTVILYTDGFTEAFAPDGKTMFGLERLGAALGGPRTQLPLNQCAEAASLAVEHFTGQPELQDDQTLFLLRRR